MNRNVAVGVALLFGSLALFEGAARIAYTVMADWGSSSGDQVWWVSSPTTGWTPAPGFSGPEECGRFREFDSQGLVSRDAQQLTGQHKSRVIFLGDSNTFGLQLTYSQGLIEIKHGVMLLCSTGATPSSDQIVGISPGQGLSSFNNVDLTATPNLAPGSRIAL